MELATIIMAVDMVETTAVVTVVDTTMPVVMEVMVVTVRTQFLLIAYLLNFHGFEGTINLRKFLDDYFSYVDGYGGYSNYDGGYSGGRGGGGRGKGEFQLFAVPYETNNSENL